MAYQNTYQPVSPNSVNVQTPDDPFYNQTNKFALDQAKIIGDERLEQTNAGLEKLSQYSKTALDMFTNLKGAVQRNAYTRGLIEGAKPATADEEETQITGDAAAEELIGEAANAQEKGKPQGIVNRFLGAALGWQRGVEQGRFNQTMQELPLYLKKLARENDWDQLPPEEYHVAMKEASADFIRQTGLDGEPIYWNPDNQLLLHQTAQKAINSALATHTARYDLMQAGANQAEAFNILGTTIDEAAETGDYTEVSKAYHQAGVAAFVNKANTSRAIAVQRRHNYIKPIYINGSPEVREAIENFIILDGPGKGKKFGVHRKHLIQEWKRNAYSTQIQDFNTENTLRQQASEVASRELLKRYSEDGYISPAEIDDYINNHHDPTLQLPNWVRLSRNEHTRGREESNREDQRRFAEADIYKDEKALRELMDDPSVNPAVRQRAANALMDLQKSGDAQHKHEYEGIENAVEIQTKISQTGKSSLHGNAIKDHLKRDYLLKQAELIKENEVAKGRKLTSQEIKLAQQQAAQSVIDTFHERLRDAKDNKDAAFYQDATGFPNIIKELTKGLPATVQDRIETANDLFNANSTNAIADKKLFNLTHEELRNNMEIPPAVKAFARIHGMNSLELWQDHLKKAHGIEMKQVSTRGFNVSMFPESVKRLLADDQTASLLRVNRVLGTTAAVDPNLGAAPKLPTIHEYPGQTNNAKAMVQTVIDVEAGGPWKFHRFVGPDKPEYRAPLDKMTVQEVYNMAYYNPDGSKSKLFSGTLPQRVGGGTRKYGADSHAAGAGQFHPDTMMSVIRSMGLDPKTTYFTPKLQLQMILQHAQNLGADINGGYTQRLHDIIGSSAAWQGIRNHSYAAMKQKFENNLRKLQSEPQNTNQMKNAYGMGGWI